MPIMKRGSVYHVRRRTPRRYQSVEPRKEIWISLGTDSLVDAQHREAAVWDQQLGQWEALLRGDVDVAEHHYQAARQIAKAYKVKFMPAAQVAELPVAEFVERVEKSMNPDGSIQDRKAKGILGTVRVPGMTMSKALDEFWVLTKPDIATKSENQVRLWQNPRKRAFRKFIEAVGDIELTELSAEHMLEFRSWQWEQIEEGGITSSSANKDFTHFASVLRKVNKMKALDLGLPLTGFNFKESAKNTRDPFSTDWIRDHFIDHPALLGMNSEARGIVQCMINTGGRLSEIASLRKEDISLEGDIPFIHIRPKTEGEGRREIKNNNSVRIIPLTGVSLRAMRANPTGFERYYDKSGASATINKFLRSQGLMQTPKHTIYGLRHSFEDRMLEAGIDERVRKDFLGHSLERERYGEGGSLKFRLTQLERVAL